VAPLCGSDALTLRDKGGDERHAVDLVTEADLRADAMICDELARLFPGVTIVSEERPRPEAAGTGDCFILDPIDGTHNFAAGLPFWGISLARVSGSEVREAWILDGSRGDLYRAKRGQGAFRAEQRLKVTQRSPEFSLLSIGFSRQVVPLLLKAHRFCGMRVLGSHALGLALAAAGDVGIHAGSGHPWDVAAGYLLIEEAGGKIVDFSGGPRSLWSNERALAGAPHIVDLALEILRSAEGGQ
jgi:myo-inositol-1(or 4)-monophosphatase